MQPTTNNKKLFPLSITIAAIASDSSGTDTLRIPNDKPFEITQIAVNIYETTGKIDLTARRAKTDCFKIAFKSKNSGGEWQNQSFDVSALETLNEMFRLEKAVLQPNEEVEITVEHESYGQNTGPFNAEVSLIGFKTY